MKNDDRIDRLERFKRLRYRPTDRPTDGHDLLQKCEDALKKVCYWQPCHDESDESEDVNGSVIQSKFKST